MRMRRHLLSMHLLTNDCIQFSHCNLFCSINCSGNLLLVFCREERKNLGDDGIESLSNLCLFVHLNIQSVGHLIIHDIMSLHLCLLCRQFFQLQFQRMILGLEEGKLFFDSVTILCDSKLDRTRLSWRRTRVTRSRVHL